MQLNDLPLSSQNRLLASLSPKDYELLKGHLEPVDLAYRQLLYPANRPIKFVYFLETGVGSLVNRLRNGDASEVGTIGNEGIVGLPIVFGDNQAPNNVYMQVPGTGTRMNSDVFAKAFERSITMKTYLLHYAHAFFNQVAQSVACAHHHSLEQRCCRWLLMTYDRMRSKEFLLTQEFLAMMLGVRRAGVTVAAGELQKAELIRYWRGHITILDVAGLKAQACECYDITRKEFDRLLGPDSRSIPSTPAVETGTENGARAQTARKRAR
jgi:CRP-like cAMP-binding protein